MNVESTGGKESCVHRDLRGWDERSGRTRKRHGGTVRCLINQTETSVQSGHSMMSLHALVILDSG